MKLKSSIHHTEYLPTGEQFLEQRDYWHTPYKFNGKELDEETGYYYYGARYYTPELGVWLSVDPLADKYPSMSAFMYCAGNPVVLVDPDGREIYVANNEQSRTDIKSIVGAGNQDRISFDNKTGRIKFNTEGMTEKEIKSDSGLSLLMEMDKSDKKMLYEAADITTITDENCRQTKYPVYNSWNTKGAINASVGGKDSNGGNTFKPKDGFDGQVVLASTGSFWSKESGLGIPSGGDVRSSTVFHELAENYYRTHFGYDYHPNSSNNNYGAHQRAVDREYPLLFRNPKPGSASYSPKK